MVLRRVLALVLTIFGEILFPFGVMYAVGLIPMWVEQDTPGNWSLYVCAAGGGIVGGLLLVAWIMWSLGSDISIEQQAARLAQIVAISGGMALGSFQGAQWWQPEIALSVPTALIIGLLGTIVVSVVVILRGLDSAPHGDGY